jgi:hypothetical protein
MTGTVVLPAAMAGEIARMARQPDEIAGVLLCSVARTSDDLRLLAREMIWLEESAYDKKTPFGLLLNAQGYTRPLSRAETLKATAVWVHTHPGDGGAPSPSIHDTVVDKNIADVFRLRSGSRDYGALIFSPRPDGFAFTGHINGGDVSTPLEQAWIVGSGCRLVNAYGSASVVTHPMFDRNVRAFGGDIQRTLGRLHVAVIGAGGTGSAVGEQLVRLGVRRLTIIDPDTLSISNVTRVYGSAPDDVGKRKVEVLAAHLHRIAPDLSCNAIPSSINIESTARTLLGCDVIFGCTDDNAGRLVLSRIPTYLLTPVIDCGVLISSEPDGTLRGIDGRVTSVMPGDACLICRDRIDLSRAGAELLTPEERHRREDEGYAPALGLAEPAVVTFTTLVAASAVNELLERLLGYGPLPRPTEILLRFHEREISTNVASPRARHYCHPESGKMGVGAGAPFLGLTWAA